MKSRRLFFLSLVALLGIANISMAQEPGHTKTHPSRAEVNQRLINLNHRIHDKEANREMSQRVADHLRQRGRQIHQEERRMASRHNGHVTKREQSRLNHQENHLSKKIHRA
jgi:hypothetical protein